MNRLDKIADSSFVKSIGKIAMLLIVPAILWVGGTLASVDRRLFSMEQQLKISPPVVRDEFVSFKDNVAGRFTANERWIGGVDHRLGVFEDARARVGPHR